MTSRAPDHRFMASLTLPFFHPLCSAPFSAAFQTHRSDPASGPLHLLPLALPGYLSPRWPHGRLLPPHPSPLMSLAFPDWPPYGNSPDPPHCSLPSPPFWSPASAFPGRQSPLGPLPSEEPALPQGHLCSPHRGREGGGLPGPWGWRTGRPDAAPGVASGPTVSPGRAGREVQTLSPFGKSAPFYTPRREWEEVREERPRGAAAPGPSAAARRRVSCAEAPLPAARRLRGRPGASSSPPFSLTFVTTRGSSAFEWRQPFLFSLAGT